MLAGDKQEKLPMALTISRITGGDESIIKVTIRDTNSNIEFASVELTPADFTMCVTGLACSPCIGSVSGLEIVGKTMEMDTIEFELPEGTRYSSDRIKIAKKKAIKECPEEWKIFDSFNSQDSFFNKDDKEYARCTIRRWV